MNKTIPTIVIVMSIGDHSFRSNRLSMSFYIIEILQESSAGAIIYLNSDSADPFQRLQHRTNSELS